MYRGFVLKLDIDSTVKENENLINEFVAQSSVKQDIQKDLKEYLDTAQRLDGTKMQEDWFPEVKAHVFISHAHQDEKLAGFLAYLLSEKFGIVSFIDSFVWGYAGELLKAIDNEYCLNVDQRTYDYEKRNYSTSHVHMMLSTALTKMIDKSECVLFLHTTKSVVKDRVIDKTYSPWIYHEIATTNIIRKKTPDRELVKQAAIELPESKQERLLEILQILDFRDLTDLDKGTFFGWLRGADKPPEDALDELYELVPHARELND